MGDEPVNDEPTVECPSCGHKQEGSWFDDEGATYTTSCKGCRKDLRVVPVMCVDYYEVTLVKPRDTITTTHDTDGAIRCPTCSKSYTTGSQPDGPFPYTVTCAKCQTTFYVTKKKSTTTYHTSLAKPEELDGR